MKTSNKIIWSGAVVFVLFAGSCLFLQMRCYERTKPYADQLVALLETRAVHTVMMERVESYDFRRRDASENTGGQYLRISGAPTPAHVRVSGDTLYLSDLRDVRICLSGLQCIVRDGVPRDVSADMLQPDSSGASVQVVEKTVEEVTLP